VADSGLGDGRTLVLHTLTSILQVWTHLYPKSNTHHLYGHANALYVRKPTRPAGDVALTGVVGPAARPTTSRPRRADCSSSASTSARRRGRAVHAGAEGRDPPLQHLTGVAKDGTVAPNSATRRELNRPDAIRWHQPAAAAVAFGAHHNRFHPRLANVIGSSARGRRPTPSS